MHPYSKCKEAGRGPFSSRAPSTRPQSPSSRRGDPPPAGQDGSALPQRCRFSPVAGLCPPAALPPRIACSERSRSRPMHLPPRPAPPAPPARAPSSTRRAQVPTRASAPSAKGAPPSAPLPQAEHGWSRPHPTPFPPILRPQSQVQHTHTHTHGGSAAPTSLTRAREAPGSAPRTGALTRLGAAWSSRRTRSGPGMRGLLVRSPQTLARGE